MFIKNVNCYYLDNIEDYFGQAYHNNLSMCTFSCQYITASLYIFWSQMTHTNLAQFWHINI